MAKELDGFPVVAGDKVYDIYDNVWLTVTHTYGDRFAVMRAGSGGVVTRTIGYDGVASNRIGRTVYWNDPRIAIPPKGDTRWRQRKLALKALLDNVVDFPSDDRTFEQLDFDETYEQVRARETAAQGLVLPSRRSVEQQRAALARARAQVAASS